MASRNRGRVPVPHFTETQFLGAEEHALFPDVLLRALLIDPCEEACKQCGKTPSGRAFSNDARCVPLPVFYCRSCWVAYMRNITEKDKRRWYQWASALLQMRAEQERADEEECSSQITLSTSTFLSSHCQ